MGRLIDVDALYSEMTEEYKKHYAGSGKGYDFTIAMQMVQNQPTAYDPEAVVAELDEILDEFYLMEPHDQENPYNEGVQKGYKCALEIVRKGGKGALRGCRNCKHQPEPLTACEWLKLQGQFIRECPEWEGKE